MITPFYKLSFVDKTVKYFNDNKVTVVTYKCNLRTETGVIDTFTVEGKATCSPTDTINPQLGHNIADSRAKQKAYKRAVEALNAPDNLDTYIEDARLTLAELLFAKKMKYLCSSEDKHIKFITKELK